NEYLLAVHSFLGRILRRIESSGPGILQYFNAVYRIATCGHRPEDLVHIGGIDIVVDGNDPLREVGAAGTLRRDGKDLLCVSGITLLEGNDHHAKAAGGSRMGINSFDTGDAEFIQIVPYSCGTDYRKLKGAVIGCP